MCEEQETAKIQNIFMLFEHKKGECTISCEKGESRVYYGAKQKRAEM